MEKDIVKEALINREVTQKSCCKVTSLIPIYILIYSLVGVWILVDGWLNDFAFLLNLWTNSNESIPNIVRYLFFTMIGSLFGSGILSIVSFHKYSTEKSFDDGHLWGFWLSPLLGLLVGILIFAIVQSGLVILSGGINNIANPENSTLGYLAIGGVAGYNWDVFVKKLQKLSKDVIHPEEQS